MKKERISREIFLLAVFTSFTVFTWIGLDVWRAFFKKEVPEISQIRLEPLNPELDVEVIENLKTRKLFTFEEVAIPTVSPEKTGEELETETVTPTPTPEETEGL